MDYIERIKKIKGEKKITNDRLSELTGIPLGTLSKLLAGMSDSPKLSNVIAIAEALDCSLDYIVNGTSDNKHNFTLSADEISFIEKFRALDPCGRDIVLYVVDKEYGRIADDVAADTKPSVPEKSAKILSIPAAVARRTLFLYDMPVSAGTGVYLDESTAEQINIPDNEKTSSADFALRISGRSMEPKYHDGDVLLVENCDMPEVGELGIFVLDGSGYFKKFGGDRLISLNPEFTDILLKNYENVVCCGRVIGKLKRK